MKISIIGPGSIGLLLYSRIKISGEDVEIVDYKRERVDFLKRKKINFISNDGKRHRIECDIKLYPSQDSSLFINCVKAYSVKDSLKRIKKFLKGKIIIALHNGIGWERDYLYYLKKGEFLRGIILRGSTKLSENSVKEVGKGGVIVEKKSVKNLIELKRVFERAGISFILKKDIEKDIYKKFLINSCLNPVAAVSGLPNGKVYEDGLFREIMFRIGKEIMEIFKKKKIDLRTKYKKEIEKVCMLTYRNINSMLQDIRRGKRTEIDYLNGYILKEAEKLKILLPYNNLIYRVIKFLEKII
ncbi:MAG: hypothetical protein DRI36_02910 [Caldiserica bacterium]|nr:MAG: hypothetical protein DRI36_02910 [Caldisericota bacterium]